MKILRLLSLFLVAAVVTAGPLSGAADRHVAGLFQRIRPAVIRVAGTKRDRLLLPTSGVFVGPNSIALTWSRRAKVGETMEVRLTGFENREAKVIARDPATGVTALRVEGRVPAFVRAADGDLVAGKTTVSAGHGFGMERADGGAAAGLGTIAHYQPRTETGRPARYLVSLAVNPGDYGGPLFTGDGRLAGVLLPVKDRRSDFFQAVPIGEVRRTFATNPAVVAAIAPVAAAGPDEAAAWPVHAALSMAARRAFPSTVSLTVVPERKRNEKVTTRIATGLLVDRDGHILTTLTNLHRAAEVQASLADGRSFPARRVGEDGRYDLALLRVDARDLPEPADFSVALPRVGAFVAAVGNPNGRDHRNGPLLSFGLIGAHGRPDRRFDALHTDAAINRANSGGALVDLTGRIVGVPTTLSGKALSQFGANSGIGFAVPSATVLARLPRLKAGEKIGYQRGYLGVEFDPDPSPDGGLRVEKVVTGQAAEVAGILANDRLTALDGFAVRNNSDVQWVFSGYEEGQEIAVTVVRDDKTLTLTATLGKR